jgi:predicted esterase
MIQKIFLYVILLITLPGCVKSLFLTDPRHYATRLANKQGFQQTVIPTKPFNLTAFYKLNDLKIKYPLTIYIEGDGHAWLSRTRVSPDPTPHNPLALKLAMLDPRPNVVYLARPCQYGEPSLVCKPAIWTDERFSECVIASMNAAVESLKQKYHAQKIRLVGFSGGAAVAILIAARRNDVIHITTIAGDLDHEALSAFHKTTPLKKSLNPKQVASKIGHIKQDHLIGDKDPIVPLFLSETFINTMPKNAHIKRTIYKGFTHHEGWEEIWQHSIQEINDSKKTGTSVAQNNPFL